MTQVLQINFLGITGLGTDPSGPCFGMREWAAGDAVRVAQAALDACDGAGEWRVMLEQTWTSYDRVDKASARTLHRELCGNPARLSVAWGHSFGGGALKYVGDCMDVAAAQAKQPAPQLDLALLADPCPNIDRFGQLFSWQLADLGDECRWHAPRCWRRARCIYQRREQVGLFGVCGVPLAVDMTVLDPGFRPRPDLQRVQDTLCRDVEALSGCDHVGVASCPAVHAVWAAEIAAAALKKAVLK